MSDDLQLRLRVHSNPAWAADEIQRLRAENVTLHERLTITPEMVERALAAFNTYPVRGECALLGGAVIAALKAVLEEAPDGKP